jgi:hypothetical protein
MQVVKMGIKKFPRQLIFVLQTTGLFEAVLDLLTLDLPGWGLHCTDCTTVKEKLRQSSPVQVSSPLRPLINNMENELCYR